MIDTARVVQITNCMDNYVDGGPANGAPPLNLSAPSQCSYVFGGAMYAWPFHCGVAAYIQEHFPLHPSAQIFGTSSGSLAASLLACGVDIREHGLGAANRSTDAHIGKLGPYFNPVAISESLRLFTDVLPHDAHERVSGRLVITLTQVPSMRAHQVTHFPNREALIEALKGTMALPGHSVHLAFRTRALGLGWVLDGGLRATELGDPRRHWRTVRVTSFRPNDLPPMLRGADIHPDRRVGVRARFLTGQESTRGSWFDHGYERARLYFEKRPS